MSIKGINEFKGGHSMKYVITALIAILIVLIFSFTLTAFINKGKSFKEKLKITFMFSLVMLPIVLLLPVSLFATFKASAVILSLEVSNYQLFLLSILGLFIIFICDFVSKQAVTSIGSNMLSKKYGDQDLSEEQMLEIICKKQANIKIWNIVIIFLASLVLYMASMAIISIEFTGLFLVIISIINILNYQVFFRSSYKTVK